MWIIGCDYHPSVQQIAWVDTETGECGERRLTHAGGEAEQFYRELQKKGASVRVGIEALEPDTEKREIEIPTALQKALGTKLTQKLRSLSFTHKKEFIVWYSGAKQEDTRARRLQKMKQMLGTGKVIS